MRGKKKTVHAHKRGRGIDGGVLVEGQAIPSFVDPDWDDTEGTEADLREQYRGIKGDDDY